MVVICQYHIQQTNMKTFIKNRRCNNRQCKIQALYHNSMTKVLKLVIISKGNNHQVIFCDMCCQNKDQYDKYVYVPNANLCITFWQLSRSITSCFVPLNGAKCTRSHHKNISMQILNSFTNLLLWISNYHMSSDLTLPQKEKMSTTLHDCRKKLKMKHQHKQDVFRLELESKK